MNLDAVGRGSRRAAVLVAVTARNWLGLLLLLATVGCGSLSEPGSASFAAVTIENHDAPAIAQATAKVFQSDGYDGEADAAEPMIFEKEASRGTTLSRAGLVAAHEGERTIYRVRVEIVSVGEHTHRLQCQAYVVTGTGLFEDEVRLTSLRSGPYRSLLKRVKAELK